MILALRHQQAIALQILANDEPAPPVTASADAQPAPLAKRVVHQPIVTPDDAPIWRHHIAGLRRQIGRQKLPEVALTDEAHAGRILLLAHGQPIFLRNAAHFGLCHAADRENRLPQLFLMEHIEEITLIFVRVNAAQKVAIFVRPHKMPRRHFRRAKLHGKIQKCLELDFAIAQHIRVRRAPRAVFFEEVAEHAIPVFAGKIDRIVGNADDFAHLAHVVPIVFRRTYAGFVRLFPVLHEHADHVVPLLFKQQRRDRRIHAAGHAHHNSLAHASASISRWMTFSVMSRLTSSAGFAASTTMNRSGSRRMSS